MKGIMIFFLIFLSMQMIAQDKLIRGMVVDGSGLALPGVTVQIEGTTRGTLTSVDGRFSIVATKGDIVVFSSVGMQANKIQVDDRTEYNITMGSDDELLDQVVVVGYGVQRKSDLTGSVTGIDGEDLLDQPVVNALQGLQGKAAGVTVLTNSGAPGGAPRVIIRGAGTINASTDPLYVVDGVAMEGIDFLNPNDIESMEVLKDASSTSIYGARGANGVILITTKRGNKQNGITVTYNTYGSVSVLSRELELLDANQWVEAYRQGIENSRTYYKLDDPAEEAEKEDKRKKLLSALDNSSLFKNGKPLYNTNWQKEATRSAFSQDHSLSVQQRGTNSSMGLFLNYGNHEGIMLNSDFERMNAKLVMDIKAKDWLKFESNVLINSTVANEAEEFGGSNVPRRTMIEAPPILPVKFPNGNWSSWLDAPEFGLESHSNPVHVLETQKRVNERNQILGNIAAVFTITDELTLKTQYGIDRHFNAFFRFTPSDLENLADNGRAVARVDRSTSYYWQQESYLTYVKSLGDHFFNAVVGLSWQERVYNNLSGESRNFADNVLSYYELDAGTEPSKPSTSYNKWALNSYFGRLAYTYKEKYLLTATIRYDGSSRFGENNKYGFFPSIGLGWNISKEPFIKNSAFIDYLKLRTSIGRTGNTEFSSYGSLANVMSSTTLIDGTRQFSYYYSTLANPSLKWETTIQSDLGFELEVLDHRFKLEIDLYRKVTSNLILDRPVPRSTGFDDVRENIGEVQNMGLDFVLTTRNINKSDFYWETTLTFNYNKNEITKLGENNEDIEILHFVGGANGIHRVGESLNSFYGYRRLGIWGLDEAEEAAKVNAKPGEAKRTTEKEILGKGMPDFTGALINNLHYKNFDFTLNLNFIAGVQVMQQYYHSSEDRFGFMSGFATILTDAWTPENQETMVQSIRLANIDGHSSQVDDHWVVDGSFLRISSIGLGYSVNSQRLSDWGISKLRFYFNVQNAYVFFNKEYQGYDPETTSQTSSFGQGFNFHQYPKPRTFSIGMNLTF